MGAFNLFKRRRHSSEPAAAKTATPGAAEASKAKSPVDRSGGAGGLLRKTSSKSKKAGNNNGTSAGIDVPALPPRVDLGILRTPSPPLVQVHVEGYPSDSPWVDLAGQIEPRRGSFGLGSFGTSSSSPTTRAVNSEKLLEYLDGKRITPEQATRLVQECTKVLQGQGLETLGIFRPWRLAESPYVIFKTLALFLRAVCPIDEVPIDDRDLLGFSKDEDAFNTFAEALANAGTHNTVACLKWGLRHLQYGPHGFGKSNGEAWSFYESYVRSEISTTAAYDRRAFQNVILEELPQEHSALLIACLELFADVAAHDAQNAMPGLHLCRLLAFWLFGRQHQEWNNWSDLYEDYLMAAACLEHLFLSYLRSQDSLPPRLVHLIAPYPPERMHLTVTDIPKSMHHFVEVGTLHVILESETPASSKKTIAHKRLPGALFASALQARHGDMLSKELRVTWEDLADSAINGEGDGVNLQSVVNDENERIFAVVAEKAEREKRVRINSDKRTSTYGYRRRSASIDVGMMQSTSSKSSDNSSNGRNRALSNDARMQTSASQPFDISWGDFETKGFCDDFDSDGFSLFSEVGRPSMDEEVVVPRPLKLKKPYPYASLASRHMPFERRYHPERDESSDSPANTTIKGIKIVKTDPIFAEVYLDSLEDAGITSKWPVFAVAELKASHDPYKAIILEVETSAARVDALPPSVSTVSILLTKSKSKPAPKPKRGLFSLGSRKKRMTVHEPESGEASDVKHAGKIIFDEFGKRIAVRPKDITTTTSPPHGDELERKVSSKYAVKTEPKPEPIAEVEEPLEERTTPSPSVSAALAARKLSRKAAPLVEDEDVLLAEVITEAGQAVPQPEIASEKERVALKERIATHTAAVEAKHADPDAGTTHRETSQSKDSSTIVPIVIVSHEEDDAKSPGEDLTSSAADTEEAASNEDRPEAAILHKVNTNAYQSEPVHLVTTENVEVSIPEACDEKIMQESVAVDCPPAIEPVKQETAPESSTDKTSTIDDAPKVDDKQRTKEIDEPIARSNEANHEIDIPAEQQAITVDITESFEKVVDEEEKSKEIPDFAAVAKAGEGSFKPIPTELESSSQDVLQNDAFQARSTEDEVTEYTPRRFGSALNRVSPSLKERFVVTNKTQSSPEQEKPSEKSPKVQAPPSPSRRAALLSGAKKMLSRKKSTPGGLVADSSFAEDAPPLPRGDGPSGDNAPDNEERDLGKTVCEAALSLEPSPHVSSRASEVQQVAVIPGTTVTDRTQTNHSDPATSHTEERGNISSSSRAGASPVSQVATTSMYQAEQTHQHHTFNEASAVRAKGTGDTVMQQVENLGDTQAIELPANSSAEEMALHHDASVVEAAEDLDPEQNGITKSGASDDDISLDDQDAGRQAEDPRGDQAATEPAIADTQATTDQDAEEVSSAKNADPVESAEPTAAVAPTPVTYPLSALLEVAQDTMAATAENLTTLAASVLPSSLIGLTDVELADENKDTHPHNEAVPPVADISRVSESTTLKEQALVEEVSQPTLKSYLADKELTKPETDNDLNVGSFTTQEVDPEDRDVIAHPVIDSERGSPPLLSDSVGGIPNSEDGEQARGISRALLSDDIESTLATVEDESALQNTVKPSSAPAKGSQQDLKAHLNRQESPTKEAFSATVEAPPAEVDVPVEDISLGRGIKPSENMMPPHNYALEFDGQQSQVQPHAHTSENILGHLATTGQVESTANIKTSAISGLPIHASQEVEIPHEEQSQPKLDDVQMKFFENLAEESVEDPVAGDKEQPIEYSGDHGALASIAESTEPASPHKLTGSTPRYGSLSTMGNSIESETTVPKEDVDPRAVAEAQEETAYNTGENQNREPNADSTANIVKHSESPEALTDFEGRQASHHIEHVAQREPSSLVADQVLAEVEAKKEKLHPTKSSE